MKTYKKKERLYAKKFLTENPIILEKLRCYLNAPELKDKHVKKIMGKMLKIMDNIDLSDIVEGYVDSKTYCVEIGSDYNIFEESNKKDKFDLEDYMDSL